MHVQIEVIKKKKQKKNNVFKTWCRNFVRSAGVHYNHDVSRPVRPISIPHKSVWHFWYWLFYVKHWSCTLQSVWFSTNNCITCMSCCFHSLIHSFFHLFILSSIRLFIITFIHSFIHSFIFIHLYSRSFIISFIHLFIHSFIHSKYLFRLYIFPLFFYLAIIFFVILTDDWNAVLSESGMRAISFTVSAKTLWKVLLVPMHTPHNGLFWTRACKIINVFSRK